MVGMSVVKRRVSKEVRWKEKRRVEAFLAKSRVVICGEEWFVIFCFDIFMENFISTRICLLVTEWYICTLHQSH